MKATRAFLLLALVTFAGCHSGGPAGSVSAPSPGVEAEMAVSPNPAPAPGVVPPMPSVTHRYNGTGAQ